MAINTTLWAVFKGVTTRFFLDRSEMQSAGQILEQTPHPRQIPAFRLAFFFLGWCGSPAETNIMASTGHTVTHFRHPVQAAS